MRANYSRRSPLQSMPTILSGWSAIRTLARNGLLGNRSCLVAKWRLVLFANGFSTGRRPQLATTHYKRAPFGGDFDPRSLRSDGRQGARPAARRSARASLRVLHCVLASASVLSSGSWRSPFLDCARFRFYEFSVVLEVMPAEKNRSTSLVARNFWAMREGRRFGVGVIVCIFTYRKEHPL